MRVFLPTAVLADSCLLVTIGGAGEVMGLFYPSRDYAQNVRECLTAVHVPGIAHAPFSWLFEDQWQRSQQYVANATILETTLASTESAVRLRITDLVSPAAPVLARRFALRAGSGSSVPLTLLQYFHLVLGDVPGRQAVRYVAGADALIQTFRDIVVTVGGDRLDGFRCGKADDWPARSAKADMADGRLTRQTEDIGHVAFALALDLTVPASTEEERVLFVAAGGSERESLDRLQAARTQGFPALFDARREADRRRVASLRPVRVGSQSRPDLERAVLALCALQDEQSGAIIAAPEFDPDFRASGGYGFCWPRDGAYAALTLARLGLTDRADAFLAWCARTQRDDGLWWQRYWADGKPGPSWCAPDRLEQLDQSASVLHALAARSASVPPEEQGAFVARFGPMARRGVAALVERVADDGLHVPAMDLWESFRGTFANTSAAIHAALRDAADLVEAGADTQLAGVARAKADIVQQAVAERFWTGTYMARGLHADGSPDAAVDSSVFGVWHPYSLLSVTEPEAWRRLLATVDTVESHLGVALDAGPAIFRFQFDTYLGGAAGAVNTLWLARVLLLAAQAQQDGQPDVAAELRARATAYFDTCRRRLAGVGMVPELLGRTGDPYYWAAPHAWGTALYIECLLALERT